MPEAPRVRLQLLSTAQNERALDVLRFLGPLVPWSRVKYRLRCWNRGWGQAIGGSVANLETFLGVLSLPANEIEASFVLDESAKTRRDEPLRLVSCSVRISPTSSLWAPVKGLVLSDRESEAQRASYESRELALKWNGVSACPTLLEAVFEVRLQADDALEGTWEALPESLPECEGWGKVFGCVDVLEPEFFQGDVLETLAPWPRSYSLLGTRVDDLHPILLGSVELCERVVDAVGAAARVKRIPCGDRDVLGAVWLPAGLVADQGVRRSAQSLLVPRDSSTAPVGLDDSRGEFRVAGHVFYTAKRLRELKAADRLPTLPPGFRHFPLIATRYCTALGIEPEEMVVDLGQDAMIERVQREIEQAYVALPSDLPLVERVWAAHAAVYSKWLYGSDQRLAFLKDRFFGAYGGRPRGE